MIVTEVQSDFDLQECLAVPYSPSQHIIQGPRTPGTHVSEVLREIATGVGLLKKDDSDELDWTLARYRMMYGENVVKLFPNCMYRVAMGLAWEEWLGRHRPDLGFHTIGELERDRILGTLDGLQFDDRGGIVHEVKLTWKSSRSDRETAQQRFATEWLWPAQVKDYCWLASTNPRPGNGSVITRGMLHVMWVNGNYKGSGPEYRQYLLEFQEIEIVTAWRQTVQVARTMERQREIEEREIRRLIA